jgi:hypothetical protein
MYTIPRKVLAVVAIVFLFIPSGCDVNLQPDAQAPQPLPAFVSARARSNHYVDVQLAKPAGPAGKVASNYTILSPDGSTLSVNDAELSEDGRQVILTTDAQGKVQYQLVSTLLAGNTSSALVPVGSIGFFGSSTREPFIESAVSLSSTSVLVTFSEPMDREIAENTSFYTIVDPDGNTDIDISILGAALDPDGTSVVLTTSQQNNIAYTITTTNVKSRFTCSDGQFALLNDSSSGQPLLCTTDAQAITTTDGHVAPFSLSARQDIDPGAPLDPDAAGVQAEVTSSTCGAGVDCDSNQRSITGTGAGSNEELIFSLDRPFRADRFILGLNEMDFEDEEPVLFASTEGAAGFDLTIPESEIIPAYIGEAAGKGRVLFESVAVFGNDVRIDEFKIRETARGFCVYSLCITDGRRVDPTRNTHTFQGIPPVDSVGPFVERAVVLGNTKVAVFFSEPLGGEPANTSHFSIFPTSCLGQPGCPELTVMDAETAMHETQVMLTTLPQTAGVTYTVTVSNVVDKAGNPIGQPDFATFDSLAPINFSPPRVVGAISTGNTSVVVTFSKPMGDSALVASHYAIVQVNLNAEVGALGVLGNRCDDGSDNEGDECTDDADCTNGTCTLSPRFLGPDRTAVELRTTSQNEVTYEVTVVNVRDLEGNQLAPPEILVNPAKAEFPGTPPSGDDIVDTDGDGLTDNEETRGYVMVITRVGGETDSREVTSDPNLADTDGDGLTDFDERTRFADPRSADSDTDGVPDFDEVFVWGTSLTNQDTDGDGLSDASELGFFKTSPLFADTDGDGLFDNEEIPLGNRDPRIADLPNPGISVGQVALRLDTRFAFTNTQGESSSVEKSTSATLSQSDSKTFSTSDSSTNQHAIQVSGEFGAEFGITPKQSVKVGLSYGYTRENTFTASQSSTQETQQQFQESLSTSVSRDVSQAVTRTVEGASVQVLVTINSEGDIPFTVRNIELTGLLQNPFDRSSFRPVATLLPASELLGGGDLDVSLGPFVQERGPFVFENREVFPSLVEDLMKNPRGLIFKVANFDIVDEDGRNFAFLSQDVNDRTAGLIMDYGTGEVDRFRVTTHGRFDQNECDAFSTNRGDFCRKDADCPNGSCDLSNAAPVGVSMAFVLQDILGMKKNEPVNAITIGSNGCGETAAIGDDVQVVVPVCPPVQINGVIVLAGPNGILDTLPAGDDKKDPTGTKIIDGGDGCAHTRASRDDIQVVPGQCERAFPDGVMVTPGPNGVFETPPNGDDVLATVTGYETAVSGACDGNTSVLIGPGANAVLDTSPAQGDDTISGTELLPGTNGVLETTPEGDDVLQGPGLGCDSDSDCPGGACKSVERVVRIKGVKNNLAEKRFWVLLAPQDIAPDVNFDDIRLHSGDEVSLAFVQDRDDDGLIAREEFLYGSSDRDDNTDGCPFGDGQPGCDPVVFDFDSVLDFDEVRNGWEIDMAGVSNYLSFPNPVLPDTDSDRLFDDEEQNLGTDPGKRDTDDDELSDEAEVRGFQILRRDGVLIRNVVPYQSAIISPGADNTLDTSLVGDDEPGTNPSFIVPGLNGVIDSIPEGDDVLETTMLILDGGNGASETTRQGDDIQIGAAPSSSTTVGVSFLSFDASGDACDDLLPGEYQFDFSLTKGSGVVATFSEDAVVQRNTPHTFAYNHTDVFLSPDETMSLFVTVREDDPQCNAATRRGVVEPLAYIVDGGDGRVDTVANGSDVQLFDFDDSVSAGAAIIVAGSDGILHTVSLGGDDAFRGAYIVEPHSGGNLIADSMVPLDANLNPLNDDVQEVAPGDPVLPGQVIVSPGADGILDTVATGDDIVPIPNGYGDTLALGDDQQLVGLAQATNPGQFIVECGGDGEPDAMLAAASPGICAASGGDPVRRPDACAEVVRQSTGGGGIAETTAGGDDVQVIAVGSAASAGAVVIDSGLNNVIDSSVADSIIEPGADNTLDSTRSGDDVTVGSRIFPGANGILDSTATGDDVITAAEDELLAAFVPGGLDCSSCPTGACVIDCSLCGDGSCVGDDVLLIRGSGDPCEDGVCPCGSCVDGPFEEVSFSLDFDINQLSFLPTPLEIRNAAIFPGTRPGPGGTTIPTFFTIGDVFTDCFSSSILTVQLDETLGAMVDQGAVLVRPGPNGVLDTTPMGDDVIGAPHLTLFATDPLNRDTDGDGLFDGAEASLGANPNDASDASKFRDNDLDGLVNIEEIDGWFIGFSNRDGLFCRNALGAFIPVDDEFAPPMECEFVVSDRFEPDTDFDGLPDLLEKLIRSDPTSEDTDGDGLLDLDEFDPDSPFSVNVGTFREFTRLCGGAERCTFDPIEEPFGTSVVLADTDGDGLDDRSEIFDTFVIVPCIDNEQLPIEVSSSPFSSDADRDGINDGAEKLQGTDPQNPDTDGDGKVDDPSIDPQADGCGKTVTVSIDSFMTGDDDCDGVFRGDGDFVFTVNVNGPTGTSTVSGSANLGSNALFNFGSNQTTFILRPGESFSISGLVNEQDEGGSSDENWNLGTIVFGVDGLTDGVSTKTIAPSSAGSGSANGCYDGANITMKITVSGA